MLKCRYTRNPLPLFLSVSTAFDAARILCILYHPNRRKGKREKRRGVPKGEMSE